MKATILVLDEDRERCGLLAESLGAVGYQVTWRLSVEEGVDLLREHAFDVVVSDIDLQGMTGIEICGRLKEARPDTPVIVTTGFGDMASAIDAIRAGAQELIKKPIELPSLLHAIERSLSDPDSRGQSRRPQEAPVPPTERGSLVGASPAMLAISDLVRRVAEADTTVLLSGESGTGKGLVARALHEQSPRCSGCFVAINCAAAPRELLESALFGHVRGAFTAPQSGRAGLFERAGEGTLLLDEVGQLPLDMQPELLRLLEQCPQRPVGGNISVPTRARIIAATQRDLEGEVAAKRFREDLFEHLNVVQIDVPPLRARGNDVLLLAEHFVRMFAAGTGKAVSGIDPEAQRILLGFDWPGNVRELENSMQRAVALTSAQRIRVEDLPERVAQFDRTGAVAGNETQAAQAPGSEM